MRRQSDITLSPQDRAAIAEATRIVSRLAPVDDVILFGSKARGEDDAESDIDLLVLTSRTLSRGERHEIIDALFPVQMAYGVVLSPVFVSSAEWRSELVSVADRTFLQASSHSAGSRFDKPRRWEDRDSTAGRGK